MTERLETEYEKIACEKYCIFCGKEIKPEISYEDYSKYTEYLCDCEGTKNIQAIKSLKDRQKELRRSADLILNPLRCEAKIQKIKWKYQQQ